MGAGNLGFDDDFLATMLGDFLDESQGYLTNLNENLMVLEELVGAVEADGAPQVDFDLLNEMFRDAHSLKGLSAMLQLNDINGLTHKIENVFDAAREQKLLITRDVVDVMFEAFDRLTGMVERLKDSSLDEVDADSVVERIQKVLEHAGDESSIATEPELDTVIAGVEPASMHSEDSETPEDFAEPKATPPEFQESSDPLAGVVDESDVPDKYLAIFIGETEESLDVLSETLIGDDVEIDTVLIVCHRIKGAAASLGLNRAAKLAHLMEDLLQELKESGQPCGSETCDALIVSVDSLRAFVEQLKSGNRGSDSFADAYRTLQSIRHRQSTDVATATALTNGAGKLDNTAPASGLSEVELRRIAAVIPEGAAGMALEVLLQPELPLVGLKAQLIAERLAQFGEVVHCDPPENELEDLQSVRRITLGVVTELESDEIRTRIDVEGVEQIHLSPLTKSQATEIPVKNDTKPQTVTTTESNTVPSGDSANTTAVATPSTPEPQRGGSTTGEASAGGKSKPAETLRVDIERLDHLMNLAGQLVINKARFGQIGEQLKGLASRKQSTQCLANVTDTLDRILNDADDVAGEAHGGFVAQAIQSHVAQIRRDLEIVQSDIQQICNARSLVNDLSEAVHQLERVSDGIQKSVMDTRMVPIGPLFGRFKRVVRDITRSNGKDIQLIIRGDKTELDKRMIDELGDPLIHMVRNAADHGVETPDARAAAGKGKQGTITLDAFHRGNRIFVQVRDDGKGLDPEKLKTKAIEKGIISQQDAQRLTREQALQLIWEPGFSTAEKITEVSGRGMGMDIVRSKIEQINGTVELDSKLGEGTTITIKLPLTMAILPSLLTVIANDVFAIPMESVAEIVRITDRDLAPVHGQQTACVRGRVISVVQLGEILHWHKPLKNTTLGEHERTLVIIRTEDDELGLIVDDLLGEEDVVIKSLAENYRNVTGVSGASILGDGRVSLILDVAAFVDVARQSSGAAAAELQLASV